MLSKELNQLLTHVGPATPMGNLLRRYWMPALLSNELPGPDSDPVRVRLMDEDLIAFRDTRGQVGLLANNCPHRGASLFFGRNEENGLRCVYHGWKFSTSGECVVMPNEPAESDFKSKVRAVSYPTHESGGIVWTYMGPAEKRPPFRNFGTDDLPPEQWRASKTLSHCNFVQAMEGNLDTAHISFLHRSLDDGALNDDGTDRPGYSSQDVSTRVKAQNRVPRVEVDETPYGLRYAGIRETPNGHLQIRMTVFAMPAMTFVSAIPFGGSCGMFVPIDDHNCWRIQVRVHPTEGTDARRPAGRSTLRQTGASGRARERLFDRPRPPAHHDLHRHSRHSGTGPGDDRGHGSDLRPQQRTPWYNRSGHHPHAAAAHQSRAGPRAGHRSTRCGPAFAYTGLRSTEKIIPASEDWRQLSTMEDPGYVELLAKGTLPLTGLLAAGALTS